MTISLRPLTATFGTVAAALHGVAGFHDVWDEKAFADLLAMPGTAGRIALDETGPAGLALWRVAADEAEILTICTVPQRRRTGVARLLLEAAAKDAAAAGARRLLLEVAVDNGPAIALYRAFGFIEAGRRKAYYRREAGTVDALILARSLRALGISPIP